MAYSHLKNISFSQCWLSILRSHLPGHVGLGPARGMEAKCHALPVPWFGHGPGPRHWPGHFNNLSVDPSWAWASVRRPLPLGLGLGVNLGMDLGLGLRVLASNVAWE